MKKDEIISKLMIMTWDSLQSHLPYITQETNNSAIKDIKTQKKIVKDYVLQIELLSKLL